MSWSGPRYALGNFSHNLDQLRRLKAKSPAHNALDQRWVRALAFTYNCRNDDWDQMLDALIEKITPLAIIERLTK